MQVDQIGDDTHRFFYATNRDSGQDDGHLESRYENRLGQDLRFGSFDA